MPVFDYKVMDVDAAASVGTIIADSPRQARDNLRGRGFTVVSLRPIDEGKRATFAERRAGRKSRAEVVAFIRELKTLLAAGIPLLESIATLVRQHRGPFKTVLQQLHDEVAGGVGLADAMQERPAYFDELCTSIVRVGESTGTLETALAKLAAFREKTLLLQSRVTTALIYPAIVCAVSLVLMAFLMTYVIPNVLGTLRESGKPMPAITMIVMGASNFILGYWWAILIGLIVTGAGLRALISRPRVRYILHNLLLRVPLVGDLVAKENTSRMAVVMAALLRSGVHFDEAVRITRQTLRNEVFRRALTEYEQAVVAGRDIAKPLEKSGVFSPLVVQMLAVGQQSGELENLLDELADSYDQQVAVATQRLTAAMEPLLIVVLSVLVGAVALATLLPILEASNVL
jgi:general secretion pathway protein F